MLKRCQVLLTDWLLEHIKLIAQKNDASLSEMIRIILCEGLLHSAPYIYPEHKTKIVNEKELGKIAQEGSSLKTTLARKHQLTSKLYFEARKAIEYMNNKVRKELKNKS